MKDSQLREKPQNFSYLKVLSYSYSIHIFNDIKNFQKSQNQSRSYQTYKLKIATASYSQKCHPDTENDVWKL